ncbi:unnamed protein product [Citrullus colocynthis]|uniref:ATP synthase subunit e, mitochondrial n=1 Tax=Citrullus colocynthis TaxID=252529 RepID=A0ABP0Y6A4_9ROSI
MALPPGPYSGTSTLALVARASAFSVGLVYGSLKLKYLQTWLFENGRQKMKGQCSLESDDLVLELQRQNLTRKLKQRPITEVWLIPVSLKTEAPELRSFINLYPSLCYGHLIKTLVIHIVKDE